MYFYVVSRQVLTIDYEQKLRCLYRNHATFTQASRVLSVTEIVLQSMGGTRNLKLRGNVGARARIQGQWKSASGACGPNVDLIHSLQSFVVCITNT